MHVLLLVFLRTSLPVLLFLSIVFTSLSTLDTVGQKGHLLWAGGKHFYQLDWDGTS